MERKRRRAYQKTISKIFSDDLFHDSSILVVASVIGGIVNYVFQIVMGRLLGPEQYGVFGSLFAFSYILLVVSSGIGYVATKNVATLEGSRLAGFIRGFTIRVGALTIAMFLVLTAASPWLANFLNVSDPGLVVLLGASILFSPLIAVASGSLRGLQRFLMLGSVNVGAALLKLVVGTALVVVGYGVYGALGAMAVSQFVVFAAVLYYLRNWYTEKPQFDRFSSVYQYALPSILVAFCFNVPTNVDVILVKHAFTPSQAGLYTSLSVFGKVLIFLPMGVSNALFPKVSEGTANGDQTGHLLMRGLLYATAVVTMAVITLSIAPSFFVNLLFGAAYLPIADLVGWYAATMAVFAVCVVFLNYSLAANNLRFVKLFTVLTLLEISLIYLFSSTMLQVVQVQLIVYAVGAILGFLAYSRVIRAALNGLPGGTNNE